MITTVVTENLATSATMVFGDNLTQKYTMRITMRKAKRENQRISMRNLGLEFLRFHHNNKYK